MGGGERRESKKNSIGGGMKEFILVNLCVCWGLTYGECAAHGVDEFSRAAGLRLFFDNDLCGACSVGGCGNLASSDFSHSTF